jgi:hypothetical protein
VSSLSNRDAAIERPAQFGSIPGMPTAYATLDDTSCVAVSA